MENEPELIRDQMQETRTALTEKLDTLQQKVADTVESITTPVTETVQTVKDAVSDTVDTVKETVSGTVESVKEAFDLSRQVERHPWPMMLGSVAAGFVLGRLLPPPGRIARSLSVGTDAIAAGTSQHARGHNGIHQAVAAREEEKREEEEAKPGLFSGLADAFQGEMDKVKSLGVSIGVGLLRDLMAQSVRGEIGGRLKEWMDGLTEKLGGKPFHEPVVAPAADDDRPAEGLREKATAGRAKPAHESTRRW